MNYLALLENSFQKDTEGTFDPSGRLGYLSRQIFDFCTYDEEIDVLFARKAVEVCKAINERKTFDYIADKENYVWFLCLCNMPFFADRLNWGTSIRGAFWDGDVIFQTYGLWDGERQMYEPINFKSEQWIAFCRAIVEFAQLEMGIGPAN